MHYKMYLIKPSYFLLTFYIILCYYSKSVESLESETLLENYEPGSYNASHFGFSYYECKFETDYYVHFNSTLKLTKCIFAGIDIGSDTEDEVALATNNGLLNVTNIDLGGSNSGKFDDFRSRVEIMTSLVCETFPNLEFLTADYLEMHSIRRKALDGCEKLKFLDLDYNALSELPMRLFTKNLELEKVSLVGNKLKRIQSEIWSDALYLEYFGLSKNKIEQFDIFYAPSLTNLDLSKNRLTTFDPDTMMHLMKHVKTVYLCDNNLNLWWKEKLRDTFAAKHIHSDLRGCTPVLSKLETFFRWISNIFK